MEQILQTLQEECRTTLEKTAKSTSRQYQFPEAPHQAKVAVGLDTGE
jgi:hypothetical protein